MPAQGDITDEFVVRPYAGGDRARLIELLQQVWPNRRPVGPHVDRRWWWQFPDPPLVVIADRRSGQLAGVCAYMPFTLFSRGRERSAAWFVDFYVLQEHQGRGFGRRLTRAVQDRFAVTASLSQTAMAWRVFQKLGWRDRAAVQIAMHPWPKPWMFRRRSGYEISRHPMDAKLTVKAGLDALWAAVAEAYPAMASRSADELVRRYSTRGGRAYDLICARRGGQCAGYMVVRSPGLIVDVLARPDDAGAFAAMLSEAGRHLIELGATRLYCLATPPAWRRVLARHGFLSAGTPLVGARLKSQAKWLTLFTTESSVPDPGDWFVTLGDCDLDFGWAGS